MVHTDYKIDNGNLKLTIRGRLDTDSVGQIWPEAIKKLSTTKPSLLEVDAVGIEYCDGAGAALLLQLKQRQEKENRQFLIRGLKTEFEQLIKIFDPGQISEYLPEKFSFKRFIERTGNIGSQIWTDLKTQISFLGELFVKFFSTILKPGTLRWGDTFLIAEKSGADAVGITCMLGFLIGLILSFQSAIAMQKFGTQIYVADLIVISLFRELGPLITAIIFASRSGSAYAAEIGTMKVNEEIDALTTMGIDPVKFLAVPRMISGLVVMPLLTMFNLLCGLIGCGLVMLSLGFPPVTYLNQIQQAASLGDLTGGMAKTLVFGSMIAGIGCLRGLQTGTGASAVGDSATKAVVSSIIAVVVVDGVFAVVYYYLGI
ncbi:MAG: ABC transporter permease [Planctomycetota bacterium]|jgi:phospholipid/cholesterol/gamma-HCH transport system permease protein